MSVAIVALLFGAGVLGGIANAIAGGATLITFPAMLAAGLPPITANASNAVAVTPGHLLAAIADWRKLPPIGPQFVALAVVAIGGGAIGAVLLLLTPGQVFLVLVPALIGAATLLFAFAPLIQARLAAGREARAGSTHPLASGAFALASIYGGYFGAGLGVMMLAILSITTRHELRSVNAMKNLLSTGVAAATVAIFIGSGAVSWPETGVMLAGAVVGGFAGGRLVQVLPAAWVRAGVIAIGAVITVVYAVRYWL
ncbi:MAG: sulfite exporter TauE/SafE family protein [Bauldia sp.]|nr:sulfite exporter TauE/SafE family protein [Bauldia sp.]